MSKTGEDQVARAKRVNEDKRSQEAARGPVRDDAATPPIGDAIRDFHDRDAVLFGIPAHRAGTGEVELDAVRWSGLGAFRADIGMDKGIDTRSQSWKVEPTAMERFADAVGADETLFSTNGSSANVHIAIMAAVRPGETIAIARSGHKSQFAGLVLSGARPVYLDPVYDDDWEVAHGVDPAEVRRALREHPEVAAVMITTPTYYGVVPDIRGIAAAVHERDLPLICDDAWGLDFSFSSRLPESALVSGADLAIGSVHKSLSGLQQTSVLSRKGERIDPARLRLIVELEQSTSASSLLLSSIDGARVQFARDGERILGHAIDLALRLREEIDGIDGLDLMTPPVGAPGVVEFDPTHVSFDVTGLGLTGYAADDWLREHHRVHVELSDHRRLMAIVTYADTDERIDRLVAALRDLAAHHAGADHGGIAAVPPYPALRLEQAMLPRDAFLGRTELVPWKRAAGRVSAEMICPYPPGVPIAAPGERLTADVIDYLQEVLVAGGIVEGAADPSLEHLRVAVEDRA